MILANNDFEQTLILPFSLWEMLGQQDASNYVSSGVTSTVREQLKDVGILDVHAELTAEGRRIAGMMGSPVCEFSVRQLHAVEENILTIAMGESESMVRSRIIDSAGVASDEFLFSRTTHENALQHVFAWMGLPVVGLPEVTQTSIDSELLTEDGLDQASRGWRISCGALPGDLDIVFYQGYLWKISGVSEASAAHPVLGLEAEDTLSLSMLLHYVWGRCVGELG